MPHARLALLGLMLSTLGCVDAQHAAKLQQEITQLRAELTSTNKELTELQQQVSFDRALAEATAKTTAYLTPGSDGFSSLQTELGRITVSLENVEAYANGSRVTLSFGNPMSATLTGAKATVEWGTVDSSGVPDNASTKSKEITFTQAIRPGSWTNIPLVLEGTPPVSLGFVRVKALSHTGISLLRAGG